MVYKGIRCKCGAEARIVESGVGTYIHCTICDRGTHMCSTKEEAIEKFKEMIEMDDNKGVSAAVAPVQPGNTVIPPYKSYQEYKNVLDNEVRQEFEGYVRIGYLLKLARDTNILYESGYKDLYEFANAEYHLDKSRVSRYMAINDRFAEDGYSMELKEEYKGFGIAKLQLMLQLPDAINEGLTPEYTKSEIQAIKDEVDEESKVSDIERMLEPKEDTEKSLIGKVIMQLAKDEPGLYLQIAKVMKDIWSVEDVKEIMAPDGVKTYSVRIPGCGRMMLMLDESKGTKIVNTRTGEAEDAGWGSIGQEWEMLVSSDKSPEEHWEDLYCEKWPLVAPVQPEKPKKESKVVKAKPDKVAKPQQKKPEIAPAQQEEIFEPENVIKEPKNVIKETENATLHDFNDSIPEPDPMNPPEDQDEGQQCDDNGQQSEEIQGQDTIENHKEWMPDTAGVEKETAESESGKESAIVKARIRIEWVRNDMGSKNYKNALTHAEELVQALREVVENG